MVLGSGEGGNHPGCPPGALRLSQHLPGESLPSCSLTPSTLLSEGTPCLAGRDPLAITPCCPWGTSRTAHPRACVGWRHKTDTCRYTSGVGLAHQVVATKGDGQGERGVAAPQQKLGLALWASRSRTTSLEHWAEVVGGTSGLQAPPLQGNLTWCASAQPLTAPPLH